MRHFGGVIVDVQPVHATHRDGSRHQIGMKGDRKPTGKSAIGIAGQSYFANNGNSLRHRCLDSRPNVGLFAPAPAIVLDRLAPCQTKPS